MLNSKYKLRYLPLFYEDLNEKVEYIAYEKLNPDAALRLIDNVEASDQICKVRVRILLTCCQSRSMISYTNHTIV